MIPIRDVIPSRTMPTVTLAIIAVMVLVFAALRLWPDAAVRLILTYGLLPAHVDPRTVVASQWLHLGLLHVGANALAIWLCGGSLEDRLGHTRFLVLVLAGGSAGHLASAVFARDPSAPLIGASAATAAIMGGYFTLFPRSRVLVLVPAGRDVDLIEIPAATVPALWLVLQLFVGLPGTDALVSTPPASPEGLVTGAAAGAVAAVCLRQRERLRVEWWGA